MTTLTTTTTTTGTRPFQALVRRDLGVAAPIALTAAALVALAAVALAGLPLLGRDAADALAVRPSSGLLQRLALLPDLLRLVLLLVPGWCAAAMAVADGQHRLGALGAALPVDARVARRARVAALAAIGAVFALPIALQVAAAPDTQHELVRMGTGTFFVVVVMGSVSLAVWASAVARACRQVPMACASATVAAVAALAAGLAATWGALLLFGWVANAALGLNDQPGRLWVMTAQDAISGEIGARGPAMLLPGALAASIALGWASGRALRRVDAHGLPRPRRARPSSIAWPAAAFLGVALAFAAVAGTLVLRSGDRAYALAQSRRRVAEARELRALPAGALLERYVTRPAIEGLAHPSLPFMVQTFAALDSIGLLGGLGAAPFAYTSDPLAEAVADAAMRQPAEVRATAAAIAGDPSRTMFARLLAASWLGPAAAAEFAARELPRAQDDVGRWLAINALEQSLGVGARTDWHAVASGAPAVPPIVFLELPRPGDHPCDTRLHALIMLQILRWQADGSHRTSIDHRSLGQQFIPTLTVPEIDAARRVLEQPLPQVAAAWRGRSAGEQPDPTSPAAAPDADYAECLDRPLSALLDATRTDPSWLAPPPAAK